MSDVRVVGIGAYAPRLRVSAAAFEEAWGRFDAAGVEEKAVPDADEDALTMAVEAAERALAAADRDAADVSQLAFATTTPPMAEEDLTARLVSILGAPDDASTMTAMGSTRAGGQALGATLDAGSWEDGVAVVVASDCPRGAPDSDVEHAAGAGAAALVLDDTGPGRIVDRATHIEAYPGTRFRSTGSTETTELGVTQYERQSFTDVLGAAASAINAGDVDAAAVQSPDGKLPYRAADAIGVDTDTIAAASTVHTLGDTGAASAFLGAARAFDDDVERALLVAYGSGAGADAFVVEGEVPTVVALEGGTEVSYAAYLRRRGRITAGEPDGGGAYVSVPSWKRTLPQRHRLLAGRCPECDALVFPPDGACTSCNTRNIEYAPVPLPGTGTIEAVTSIAQGGAPPEFVSQQSQSGPYRSAVVAFDDPDETGTVSIPSQVLVDGAEPSIGTRVEAVTRRVYTQEGVIRYGYKVQPVDDAR